MCDKCRIYKTYEDGRSLYTNFVTALCLKDSDIFKEEIIKK